MVALHKFEYIILLNWFLTISDVVLSLSHEASLAQFTFHTYVLIFAYLNGLQFAFWQADNAGGNFFTVNF